MNPITNTLKQGETFTDSAGRTGIVNFDAQTGKPLSAGQTTNIITPKSLQPVTPIQGLPTTPVPTVPTVPTTTQTVNPITTIMQGYDATQQEEKAKNIESTGFDQYLKDLVGLQGEGQYRAEEFAKTDYTKNRQQLLNAENRWIELEAEKAKDDITLASQLRAEERRDTLLPFAQMGQAKIAGDAQIVRALKTAEQGMLTARQMALQNNLELASEEVERAVAVKYAPFKERIATWEKVSTAIQPYLDSAEKKELAKQNFKAQLAMKEIEKAEEDEKTSNSYLFTAIQGKAPQSLIAKAQDLINKGAKPNEVAKVLGQYSMSLGDRLDIQLKQRQIDKINTELSTKNPDAGELVKINGKDYIRYKDGTISEPVLPEAGDTGVVVSRLDNKLKTLDKLTKGSVGLSYSAGALRTPLGKPLGFINQINDWRADAVNVIQKLTVDELGRVKSDGVTFGALSNGERQAVGDAATALGAASVRDKEGNPTGEFKMSEKKVLEEFNKIKQGYALDFERRTGIPYEKYLENPEVVRIQAVGDFIDSAGTALINNNLYEGYPTN